MATQSLFNAAPPAMPTQNVTEFDTATAALERRRKLAQLLQEQSISKGMQLADPKAQASWLNALAPVLGVLAGQYADKQAGEEQTKVLADREAATAPLAEKFYSSLNPTEVPGQAAIPAMDMGPPDPRAMPEAPPGPPQPPAMPAPPQTAAERMLAETQGQAGPGAAGQAGAPMIPSLPGVGAPPVPPPPDPSVGMSHQPAQAAVAPTMIPPDLVKALAAGNAYARVGGPEAQKAVDAMIPHLTKNILPSRHVTEGGVWEEPGNNRPGRWLPDVSPGTKIKTEETAAAHRAAEAATEANRIERARVANMSSADRARHEETLRAIAQMRAGAAGDGGGRMFPTDQYSLAGNPVVRGKDGKHYELINGMPAEEPVKGPLTDKATMVKAAADATKTGEVIGKYQSVLKDVEENPKHYEAAAALSNLLPSYGDVNLKLTGSTEEQVTARTQAMAITADVKHSLYGSAFTASEAADAKLHLIKPSDGPIQVAAKIKGRMELEKRHMANISPAGVAAYNARKAGGGGGDLRSKYGVE